MMDDLDEYDAPDTCHAITPELERYVRGLPPNKSSNTVRIFSREGYYVLIGSDAEFVGLEIRKTKQGIKAHDSLGCYLIQSETQFESEIREMLLVKQYRLEIHKKATNGLWSLDFVSTPGNFGCLEDVLYSAKDNLSSRGLLSINMTSERHMSVVLLDSVGKLIRVTSFQDDSHLSTFESILVQFAPRETIISDSISSKDFIEEKLKLNNITVTVIPWKEFFGQDYHSILFSLPRLLLKETNMKQIESSINSLPEAGKKTLLQSLEAGIKYLQLLNNDINNHSFEWKSESVSSFVKLDSSSVSSLDLLPRDREKNSLFGILNRCRTLSGQRLLSQWIRQPLMDIRMIEHRQNLVDFFVQENDIRIRIHDNKLRSLPDLMKLSRIFSSGKTIPLQSMYQLYLLTKELDSFGNIIGGDNLYVRTEFTEVFDNLFNTFSKYNSLVEEILDFERIRSDREYHIRPSCDDELSKLNDKFKEVEYRLEKLMDQVARDLGIETDKEGKKGLKLAFDKTTGYYFEVGSKLEHIVRNSSSDYELISGVKKDVRFTCQSLLDINAKAMQIKSVMDAKEQEILVDVTKIASGYSWNVKQLLDVISFLDVIVSLSVAATSAPIPFVKPTLLPKGSGNISFEKLRHPVLEAGNVGNGFIANDVDMSQHKLLLITGPNMGGKSTYIRSIAIAVLMTQMGSFVPADSAQVSVVDGIFTRVGGSDQQLLGNSTFMSEMIETANIIRSSTQDSLIIIDELGRGTSTFDAFGIAYSVSKYIATVKKSFCLFATHFQELVQLQKDIPDVVGVLHTEVYCPNQDTSQVLMTHQIKPGPCFKSFGIQVAKYADIPDHIIQDAEKKLKELEEAMEGNKGFDIKEMIKEAKKSPDVDSMTDEEVDQLIFRLGSFIKTN